MFKKLTTPEFVEKAKKIHGEKYDYSKAVYINNKTLVGIICKKHGFFWQTPNKHLSRKGCPKCGNIKKANSRKNSIDVVIKNFKKIHGEKYNYSKSIYIGAKTKIKIMCKKHGIFWQNPDDHLHGSGCPKCNNSSGENKISKFLSIMNIQYEEQKRFKNCKNKRTLPFDFYLPIHNLCIEYDGMQHFKEINFWRGTEGLKEQEIKDNIKNRFCQENSINLLRIPYWEFNNIERLLNEKLI